MFTDPIEGWDFLNRNVSTIFILASLVLFLAALRRGAAYVLSDVAFND